MPKLATVLYFLTLAFAMWGASPPVRADLVWEKKEIRLKALPTDKEVVARYVFKNEGPEVVKFKSIDSTCGCVSMTVSTMVVPVGVAGDLTVTFAPEFRIGEQKRPIVVQFDDEKKSKMALHLIVEIPEIIKPQPGFLKWAEGEAIEAKSVTIVTDERYPVESMRIRTIHPKWKAQVTPIENSHDYKLEVIPKRGSIPQGEYIEVEATLADGQVKRTNLYVVVR